MSNYAKVADDERDEENESFTRNEVDDKIAKQRRLEVEANTNTIKRVIPVIAMLLVVFFASYGLYDFWTGCNGSLCVKSSELIEWAKHKAQLEQAAEEDIEELSEELEEVTEQLEEIEESEANMEGGLIGALEKEKQATEQETAQQAELEEEEDEVEEEEKSIEANPDLAKGVVFEFERTDFFTTKQKSPKSVKRQAPFSDATTFKKAPYVINLGLPSNASAVLRTVINNAAPQEVSAQHNVCKLTSDDLLKQRFSKVAAVLKEKFNTTTKSRCTNKLNTCALRISAAVADIDSPRPFDFVAGTAITKMDCADRVVMMLPQVTGLTAILNAYTPNEAIFVLVTQDDEKWAKEMIDSKMSKKFAKLEGLFFEDHQFETGMSAKDYLVALKQWHEARVRTSLAKSGHKLIVLDPSNAVDGYQELFKTAYGSNLELTVQDFIIENL